MNLAEFDPHQIQDEGARSAIVYLLNLVEEQQTEIVRLRAENARLREENNRLKGQPKRPESNPQPASVSQDYSTEAERREPSPRRPAKSSKNATLKIDREEILPVDPAHLPADAEFKGHEAVIVQDIKVETDNIRFLKEKWYSPSAGQTYLAPLPVGYEGQFGPRLKAWVVVFTYALNVTAAKVRDFWLTAGVAISSGQIAAIIQQETERLAPEKAALYEAGLRSTAWQQIDDTGATVNGQAGYTEIVCNPYYTAYFTVAHKDRLTVLEVLWGGQPLQFCLDELTWAYLAECGLAAKVPAVLATWPQEQLFSREEFEARLQAELPHLGPQQYKWVLEAAGIAAYHRQETWPVVKQLLCDDAGQFKRIVAELVLCWVHDGRHYQKLSPAVGHHQQELQTFRQRYWEYYRQLLAYQRHPTPAEKDRLSREFDQRFATHTDYAALNERIAKTKRKRRRCCASWTTRTCPCTTMPPNWRPANANPKKISATAPALQLGPKAGTSA